MKEYINDFELEEVNAVVVGPIYTHLSFRLKTYITFDRMDGNHWDESFERSIRTYSRSLTLHGVVIVPYVQGSTHTEDMYADDTRSRHSKKSISDT